MSNRYLTVLLFPLVLGLGTPGACTKKNEFPSAFVSGTVTGLGDRGVLVIELNGAESLSIAMDGEFAFLPRFFDDDTYAVTIAEQPARAECEITGGDGLVGELANDELRISCLGSDPSLLDLGVSTTEGFTQAFDPSLTDYDLELSTVVQELRFLLVASDADASIEVEGVAVASGEASAVFPLTLGGNLFKVVVTAPSGASKNYFVSARRGDALLLHRAYGKASNSEADDSFGHALAISGDTMVVGAPGEDSGATGIDGDQGNDLLASGAAYVFRRFEGVWHQEAYLKSSSSESLKFGQSVAIDGDTIVVGMPLNNSNATGVNGDEDDSSAEGSGAVYVFRRTHSTWQQEAFVKASNTGIADLFGSSIALFGDTMAVGAHFEASNGVNGNQADDSAAGSGAVYVFRRTGTNWQQEAYLKASNAEASDSFGFQVTLAEDLLAVGAVGEDSRDTGIDGDETSNLGPQSGAVYIFHRSGAAWQQEAYIKASNTGEDDFFGHSLAFSGDTLAVTAFGEDSNALNINGNQSNNNADFSGAVYVYRRSGTTWAQEAYIKPSNTTVDQVFGFSLALVGDMLAVGAIGESSVTTDVDGDQNDTSAPDSGAVYLFRRSGTTWAQDNYVKASNTDASDMFGFSIGLSGDTLVSGSTGEASSASGFGGGQADNSASNSGALYIYQ